MTIKFGVQIWQEDFDLNGITNAFIEVEKMGFESAWIYDHFYPMSKITSDYMLEAWTILPQLAIVTNNLRLGVLVTCNSYRHPSILAKIATTVDIISKGRLEFGIGAGWFEEEYDAYGIQFPSPKIRLEQMEEGVELMKRIWTQDKANFKGKHYTIKNLVSYPKPIQKPYPPIMIGGKGDLLLKIAAKYADNINLVNCTPEEYGKRLGILKNHCSKIGRDYDEITKSWHGQIIIEEREKAKELVHKFKQQSSVKSVRETDFEDYLCKMIFGSNTDCIEQIQSYIDAGAEYIIPHFPFSNGLKAHRIFIDEIASAFQ